MEAREQAEKKQQEYAEKIRQMQEEMENRQKGIKILVIVVTNCPGVAVSVNLFISEIQFYLLVRE